MTRLAGRLVLAAVMAAAIVLAIPAPAAACSCAMGDPAQMLDEADAAFVGARTGPPVGTGDFEGDWPFRVEEWVKGRGEAEIDVRAALDGAACGFEVSVGTRVGVLLYERNGVFTSGLCSTIDGDVLLAAATPLGPLDGQGRIALLVGGTIGPYRLVALDGAGRDLARAEGDEPVTELSVCPGSDFAAELVGERTLAVRDLATFAVVWERPLAGDGRWYASIACQAADGSEVVALGASQTGSGFEGVIVRVTPDEVQTLAEGAWHDGRIAGDVAVVVAGPERSQLDRVDLATGESTTLFTLDPGEGLGDIGPVVVSPDGRRVAFGAATYHRDTGTSTLHVVDLATGKLTSLADAGVAMWVDNLTLLDETGPQSQVLYESFGDQITRVGDRHWDFTPRAAVGTTVYGTQWVSGVIRSAEIAGDETATLRVLPSIAVRALAAPVGAPAPRDASLEGDVGEADREPEPTTTALRATTITAAATTTTVPPQAAPAADGAGGAAAWWLLGGAAVAAAGAGAWLWRRRATG